MPLLATRGPANGQCNICGIVGKLTEDHTPPKGCVRPTDMVLRHVVDRLGAEKPGKGRISQNGVKYRTLCTQCNSHFLGKQYDPALIDFSKRVASLLDSPLALPRTVTVPGNPRRIMRSVWGHLAAQGVDRYLKGPDTEVWRDFFLDPALPVPPEFRFYYWIYPYRRISLMRDHLLGNIMTGAPAMAWVMKFYPLAFTIWDSKSGYEKDFRDLADFDHISPNTETDLTIDLRPVPHEYVVEMPEDHEVALVGKEAITAEARPDRGTLLKVSRPPGSKK